MATPVDQASMAELVQRLSAYIEELRGAKRNVLVQEITGPGPYTLTDALHGGKRLRIGNGEAAAAIVVNLPIDQPIGTVFLARQIGAGPLKFIAAPGSTLYHRLGHNGTAGRDAAVALTYEGIGLWLLDGDTAVVG
jgi:hypothetical protein